MNKDKISEIIKENNIIFQELEKKANTWMPHWKEISDYMLPWRGFYFTDGKEPNIGSERHENVKCGVAERALTAMGSGMQGGIASAARPWFVLTIRDKDLAKWGPVKMWLHDVATRMYDVLAATNFYTALHEAYEEQGGFGTTLFYQQPDPRFVSRFRAFTIGSYYLMSDQFGQPDGFIRQEWITVREAAQRFGKDALQPQTINLLEKNQLAYIRILHAVKPNEDWDPTKIDKFAMPYRSVWWEHGATDEALRVSGFNMFPGAASRWNVGFSDVYGNSPGMSALPDVRELQACAMDISEGRAKKANPPMVGPTGFDDLLQTWAGGYNQAPNPMAAQHSMRALYDGGAFNIQHGVEQKNDLVGEIRSALYNDLWLMLHDTALKDRTAFEVAELKSEKLQQLGPVIERQFFEQLDPTLQNLFTNMDSMGLIPPMPEELIDTDLQLEYISVLAQAQKMVGVDQVKSYVGFVAQLAEAQARLQLPPTAWDNVEVDEAIQSYGNMVGIPPKVQATQTKLKEIRAARAQAMAEREQEAREAQAIEQMGSLGQISVNEDTALNALREEMAA